jgi:hypothetical protein
VAPEETQNSPEAGKVESGATEAAAKAPAATPAATPSKRTGRTRPTPTPAATPAKRNLPPPPPENADAEVQEKYRYEAARAKALEDPRVQELKNKADEAANDDESRKAQRAYNKALFNKMRSVDSSIKERADRIEASILKRLDAQ